MKSITVDGLEVLGNKREEDTDMKMEMEKKEKIYWRRGEEIEGGR